MFINLFKGDSMEAIIKKTELIDGGFVFDLQLIPNTRPSLKKAKCIFSCERFQDADALLTAIKKAVNKHSSDELRDITRFKDIGIK